jgi:hypothetical protein
VEGGNARREERPGIRVKIRTPAGKTAIFRRKMGKIARFQPLSEIYDIYGYYEPKTKT